VPIAHEHSEHREGDGEKKGREAACSGSSEPDEGSRGAWLGGREERLQSARQSGEHKCEGVDENRDDAQGYGGDFVESLSLFNLFNLAERWTREGAERS
jgi:hypothetical protein